ncbi:Vmethyltransf C domain containing protein [Asbolus verrucosus]|uniref:Vmethyltransf C domain containing protein n=1 Tax=Asbolus verrucosus TaxID=1661398 RepID=A0A482W0U6_ASBVE|nr:Vmethyltransf C domain containing protein [Asbolus verrucosus]
MLFEVVFVFHYLQRTCPLCSKHLSLKQINFTTAVYICEDLQCNYPIGYDCITVERKFEDMDKDIELLNNREEDLIDWIDEIVEKSNDANSSETNTSLTELPVTDETTSEDPTNWIDSIINSNADDDLSTSVVSNVGEVTQVNSDTNEDNAISSISFDDIVDFVYNID